MRLVVHEMSRRRVLRHGREGDDQVAERVVRLQASAGADAHQPLAPELNELLEDDRRARAAHPRALHRDALPLPGARVPEQPALLVHLGHVVEVRLGDVLRAERVAGEKDGVGVVAGLCSEVNRHLATLTGWKDPAVTVTVSPTLDQVLAFCAEEPVERVFLEDIARRGLGRFSAVPGAGGRLEALCHVGANIVPSGSGCAGFAEASSRSGARMLIGEERAVGELWDAARRRMPRPRDDRPGQPVYALRRAPEPGETGLRAARLLDLELLVPACAAAHREEIGVDPLKRDADGFRWRTRQQIEEGRSWLWVEDGVILFKAEASAWTPAAVQLQQVWVDPAGPASRLRAADRCATSVVCCSSRSRPCACSSGPRTRRRCVSTTRSA